MSEQQIDALRAKIKNYENAAERHARESERQAALAKSFERRAEELQDKVNRLSRGILRAGSRPVRLY